MTNTQVIVKNIISNPDLPSLCAVRIVAKSVRAELLEREKQVEAPSRMYARQNRDTHTSEASGDF